MTHFLRDRRNNTIVGIETQPDDIDCVVDVRHYSRLLLSKLERSAEIITDFDRVQEIRGEFFESGWNGTTDELARESLVPLADKYGLIYVTSLSMQDRLRQVLKGCCAPDAGSLRWERPKKEWCIRSDDPYLNVRFAEPGRTAILNRFNAWAMESATHIVEVPGITEIDDPEEALQKVEWWCSLSNEEQHHEWLACEARVEEKTLREFGESMTKDLPRWGYARGGTWIQHYATEVVDVKRVKYGRDKGQVRAYYKTLCGKTLSLELMRDTKKPICEKCLEMLGEEGSKPF